MTQSQSMKKPGSYLAPGEIQEFYVRTPLRVAFDGLMIWAVVLGAFALYAWVGSLYLAPFVMIVMAARQHAMNNMVHEAAHLGLHKKKKWNDLISDIFFASPHLISTEGYRAKHLPHHAHLGHPSLDLEIKNRYVLTGKKFWLRSFKIISGLTALETAKTYKADMKKGDIGRKLRYVFLVGCSNGLLFLYCCWLGIPYAYFYLWILPMLTLFPYFAALSVIAEHQTQEYAAAQREDFVTSQEPGFTRSIRAGALERFFLAPGNFCYHMEHHAFPGVPYSKLPALNRRLEEKGYFAEHPEQLAPSFTGVLKELVLGRHAHV